MQLDPVKLNTLIVTNISPQGFNEWEDVTPLMKHSWLYFSRSPVSQTAFYAQLFQETHFFF
uniref:Uncharacterized protein n=1 Tax=Anguilla anguilla TaxID=7936 RepID=A0A0E9W0U4_ANGAN